ncbi:hypothetical protein BD560DRAFT_389756 [Blakeslea trispora]|nr:hypothetical protein BD560DRAFT_389756 [Blakeslea trispora]
MNSMLGIQVMQNKASFYMMTLPSTGLYPFFKLAVGTISNFIRDLTKLIANMTYLFLVPDVFHRLCKPSSEPQDVALD